jgi:hypothetical protein
MNSHSEVARVSRVERLTELIETRGPLGVTDPVATELLARARSDHREADLRRLLQASTCSVSMRSLISTPQRASIAGAARLESPLLRVLPSP